MQYQKKGNDEKFRRVSLQSEREPEFEKFDSETVSYPANCVLEIMKADGTTKVEYDGSCVTISVRRSGNFIYFPDTVPTQRLWVRERNKKGMAYKIPNGLKIKDNEQFFEIPAGANTAEVFGDKYFCAVYELI